MCAVDWEFVSRNANCRWLVLPPQLFIVAAYDWPTSCSFSSVVGTTRFGMTASAGDPCDNNFQMSVLASSNLHRDNYKKKVLSCIDHP
jgi:hypothetical protein